MGGGNLGQNRWFRPFLEGTANVLPPTRIVEMHYQNVLISLFPSGKQAPKNGYTSPPATTPLPNSGSRGFLCWDFASSCCVKSWAMLLYTLVKPALCVHTHFTNSLSHILAPGVAVANLQPDNCLANNNAVNNWKPRHHCDAEGVCTCCFQPDTHTPHWWPSSTSLLAHTPRTAHSVPDQSCCCTRA